ncbi:MAG: HIT domain-containing protein [Candidatus Alcyoniella australis]|nr:HIT domain-containing protein [Candidatus Alcyoniella australis]
MDRLWAPWRMEYIKGPKSEGCIFCDLPDPAGDRERLILRRGKAAYVMMNRYPYSNGHLMVAPYAHLGQIELIDREVRLEMFDLVDECVRALKAKFDPQGFNVGINLGQVAGAGVLDHVHIHVVPRWNGDTNFMTVVGELRVISEHILNTYDQLVGEFKAGEGN